MVKVEQVSRLALIALGSNANSNWGDAAETVQKAMQRLGNLAVGTLLTSSLYKTPAFPKGAGPDFVNAAAAFSTTLDAASLMEELHAIEADAMRVRERRWGQRTLDLDLIGLEDVVAPDPATHVYWRDLPLDQQLLRAPDQLILPHPRVQDRSFVLIPLSDVVPEWRHPLLDRTVKQMLADLPIADRESVIPIN